MPCAAFAAASDGDTIEIDAAVAYNGDVCAVWRNNLTIRGVGGRAKIDAAGQNAQGKGIWVVKGSNTRIENIEFTGATVPDKNGAAIRQEGANLTVRNCYFHHNENGILGGNISTSEILIEYSEFAYNGYGDGYSHNMYINHVAKFTLRFSYSHHARVGHLVKSRAAENYILYNRLSDEETGAASYELDLPNGGKSYVVGNVIHQGPATQNGSIFRYREEGPHALNPSTELFIVNNTFVNERLGGTNLFINIHSSVPTPAVIRNNIFVGPGAVNTQGSAVFTGNLTGADPLFMSPPDYDYRLRFGSPAIDSGQDPGSGGGLPLAPSFAYIHTACGEGRKIVGAIDVGAYEVAGAAFDGAAPERCRRIDAGGVVNGANFQSGPVAPGSIISIFGCNLAVDQALASQVPLPTNLADSSVTVNGIATPLYFVSAAQINAQVPFEVSPGTAVAVVSVSETSTQPASFDVAEAAPATFLFGENHAIVQNQDNSLNTPENPAVAGSVITAYLTGQGPVTAEVETGARPPAGTLAWASGPYSATIGSQPAKVQFLGLAPGYVGLAQGNIEVPQLPATGDYPLVITIGGMSSRPASVTVSVP
jgi:uncharacterized protein (TIGR03437 family)